MIANNNRFFGTLLGCLVLAGCEEPPLPVQEPDANVAESTDSHDVPMTADQIEALKASLADYDDALTKIRAYRDAIRATVAAGDVAEAHRPLDELNIVLEHLPQVASESGVPRTSWGTVNTAAQQMRELYDRLHAQIDAGEEPDYQAIADQIDAELATLEAVPKSG